MCLADKIHRNLYRTVSYDLHCNVTILKKILTKNVQDIEKLLTNKCKYDNIVLLCKQAFLFVMKYVWFFSRFVYSFYNLRLHVNIGKKLIR